MKSRYRHIFFSVLMCKKRGLATPLSQCLYPAFCSPGISEKSLCQSLKILVGSRSGFSGPAAGRNMLAVRYFLAALFPFIVIDAVLAFVVPLLPAATIAAAAGHAISRLRTASGRPAGRLPRVLFYTYYLLLAAVLYVLFRMAFPYFAILLAAVTIVCILISISKKLRPEIAAGIIVHTCTVLLFTLMLPPRFSQSLVERIENERMVTPLYLFMGSLVSPDTEGFEEYNGVRSIVSTSDDSRIYFTAEGSGADRPFGLFSIHAGGGEPLKWKHTKLGDCALTPGGEWLLVTDYYNRRLVKLDPETLEPAGSVETGQYPIIIVIDRYFDRAFVAHEGTGTFIEYSLPGLERISKKHTFSAPVAVDVDWKSGELYSSNWLFPFLLSEIDMFHPDTRRVKFPLSFAGTGVSLDEKRRRVYVSNAVSGRVLAVDRRTFKTAGSIAALPGIRPVLVDGSRELIYVGNMLSPYLRVYDFDHRLVARVFVGRNCRTLYLTPSTNRLLAGTSLGVLEVKVDEIGKTDSDN